MAVVGLPVCVQVDGSSRCSLEPLGLQDNAYGQALLCVVKHDRRVRSEAPVVQMFAVEHGEAPGAKLRLSSASPVWGEPAFKDSIFGDFGKL
eukprot:CAMPEP_0174717046 /NCGR_PEP_ID=MMETSP1094-20130205/25715_1 /TAXON_ID=156173 /ORGANISM="Chrysochromulina brevifilum, Strain UTEX LB 985" /LENGTH=91 /DNA_ID=CAMNT_0015916931 /DNA_START=53 /DNA_END=328 /DNA_ORIENTATION=+